MTRGIRVVLVDDHEMVREGLRRMLGLHPEIQVVGEAGNVEEALRVVESVAPDVVLMDIKLPNGNGLEATRQLKEKGASCSVIILSLYDQYLAQAIEAGATGYLSKDLTHMELAEAVLRVHRGELALGSHLLANPSLIGTGLKQLQEAMQSRRATSDHPSPKAEPASAGPEATAHGVTGPSPSPPAPAASQGNGNTTTRPAALTAPPTQRAGKEGKHASPPEAPAPSAPAEAQKAPDPAPEAEVRTEATDERGCGVLDGKAPDEAEVEMVIPPPTDAARLLRFCNNLKQTAFVDIMGTIGSWEKGTIVIVAPRRPVVLMDVLSQMTEVAMAREEPVPASDRYSHTPLKGRNAKESPIARTRIRVVLKDPTDPAQLTFKL